LNLFIVQTGCILKIKRPPRKSERKTRKEESHKGRETLKSLEKEGRI
jgi:hypothetical protein